MRGKTEEI